MVFAAAKNQIYNLHWLSKRWYRSVGDKAATLALSCTVLDTDSWLDPEVQALSLHLAPFCPYPETDSRSRALDAAEGELRSVLDHA